MSIEKFIWDSADQSVSWSYQGKNIKERFENLYFAAIQAEKNCVYVEAGRNYAQDQVYYLSFDGTLVFSFDKEKNKIRWGHNGRRVEVDCKILVNAHLYPKQDVILAIAEVSSSDKKILGYAPDGRLLFEKAPPEGYRIMYLSSSNGRPSVVCDGGDANQDSYGRSSWHFTIDPLSGELSKGSLAY